MVKTGKLKKSEDNQRSSSALYHSEDIALHVVMNHESEIPLIKAWMRQR